MHRHGHTASPRHGSSPLLASTPQRGLPVHLVASPERSLGSRQHVATLPLATTGVNSSPVRHVQWTTSPRKAQALDHAPLGSLMVDWEDPLARQRIEWDLQYQQTHYNFMITALSHTARRLWAVLERFKRCCLEEALAEWRDMVFCDRLDKRLKQATEELKKQFSEAREKVLQASQEELDGQNTRGQWAKRRSSLRILDGSRGRQQAPQASEALRAKAEALAKRVAAVGTARRAVPAVTRLFRSLGRIRRQQLTLAVAHWKDTTIVPPEARSNMVNLLPEEAWTSMAKLRQCRCPSKRYQFLGATEAELHGELVPESVRATRQRGVERSEAAWATKRKRIGASLLQSALTSYTNWQHSFAFAKIRSAAAQRPRFARGWHQEYQDEDEEFLSDEQSMSSAVASIPDDAGSPHGDRRHSVREPHVERPSSVDDAVPMRSRRSVRDEKVPELRRASIASDGDQNGPNRLTVRLQDGSKVFFDLKDGMANTTLEGMVEAVEKAKGLQGRGKGKDAARHSIGGLLSSNMMFGGEPAADEEESDAWPSWAGSGSEHSEDDDLGGKSLTSTSFRKFFRRDGDSERRSSAVSSAPRSNVDVLSAERRPSAASTKSHHHEDHQPAGVAHAPSIKEVEPVVARRDSHSSVQHPEADAAIAPSQSMKSRKSERRVSKSSDQARRVSQWSDMPQLPARPVSQSAEQSKPPERRISQSGEPSHVPERRSSHSSHSEITMERKKTEKEEEKPSTAPRQSVSGITRGNASGTAPRQSVSGITRDNASGIAKDMAGSGITQEPAPSPIARLSTSGRKSVTPPPPVVGDVGSGTGIDKTPTSSSKPTEPQVEEEGEEDYDYDAEDYDEGEEEEEEAGAGDIEV